MTFSGLRVLFIAGLCIFLCMPTGVLAQTAELSYETRSWNYDSGEFSGRARPYRADRELVRVDGADWLRLEFRNTDLGRNSYLKIKSLKDGGEQILNAQSLAEWQSTSAYFNGDAVQVDLYVGRGDRGVRMGIRNVQASMPATGPLSQCGPNDDRVPSNDPRSGRIVPIGCTGWIVDNGLQITAGHCAGGGAQVLQFNVPPSNANGSINNPPPQDQYAIDPNTKVLVNGGVGNDWGVFQVFDNSNTQQQPIDAQGSAFAIVQDLGTANIRITGYGTDNTPLTRNQTQQTHVGPDAGSSGTTMRYQTDTEGGNSGSPVIDEATNRAVGVHTHGGCSTSGTGNNNGTALTRTAFWDAANPDLLVTVTPDVSPVVLPPGGGSFDFEVTIENTTNQTQNFQFWTYARRNAGTGGGTDPLIGPINLQLGPGQSTTLNRTQNVPSVDPDTFVYFCAVGSSLSNPIFQDSFNFTVSAAVTRSAALTEASEGHSTSADQQTELPSPATFVLDQNYPNPFNPTTTIHYESTEAGSIAISVYDLMGRKVRELVNRQQQAGSYHVEWDGKNSAGQKVASGTYVYRIESGGLVQTRKMILLK